MFHPKRFYRELDHLLHEIEDGALYSEWYPWIVREIVARFGDDLGIRNGRVWVEDEGTWRLEYGFHNRDADVTGLELPNSYPPIRLVLEHRVYLFDEKTEGTAPELEERLGGIESAGLLIRSEPERILAFGLEPDWDREPLDFALNTIRNAIDHRLRFQDLATDLEQAAEIQRSLLPRRNPEFPGFSIAAKSIAASRVGGDFYDFLPHDDETIALALGDASGHGLAAALLARDVVTGLRMGSERSLKITETILRLNRVIARSVLSSRFASLFYGELEANGNVFYVNAGHPAPWIIGDREMRRLAVGGPILGPLADSGFKRGWAHVDRGDSLVVVSDGFLERPGPDGRHFEDAGVERVIRENPNVGAVGLLDALFEAARAHGAGRPWADDTTAMVVVRDR